MASNPVTQGAILLLLSELLMSLMMALIKFGGQSGIPLEVLVFFRNFLGLVFMLPLLINRGGLRSLATRRIDLHLWRSLPGIAAMYLFFYTITHAKLAESILVKMTTPFFLPLIGLWWLGDKIMPGQWRVLALGFFGVFIILLPALSEADWLLLLALLAAFFMAISMVSIRKMAVSEPPLRIIFWFALFSSLISAVPLVGVSQWPAGNQWWLLIGVGVLATGGQVLLTRAYQCTSPGRIGLYTYASVVWAALLGYVFWQENLTLALLLGTGIIIYAGLMNLRLAAHKQTVD